MPRKGPLPKPKAGFLQDEGLKQRLREDYEGSDIGLSALARRHGLKSKTTIIRWINAEGWTRDPDGNRDRMVREAAEQALGPAPGTQRHSKQSLTQAAAASEKPGKGKAKSGNSEAPAPIVAPDANTDVSENAPLDTQKSPENAGKGGPGARQHVSQRIVTRLAHDGPETELELAYAHETAAELQTRSIKRQLRIAENMRLAADLVVQNMHTVLIDPVGSDEYADAFTRLAALGALTPGGLGTLLKGLASMQQTAVSIERRAMGMEPRNDPVASKRPGEMPVLIPPPAADILESLPDDMLIQIRTVAMSVHKQVREGQLRSGQNQGPVIDQAPATPVPSSSKE